MKNKTKGLLAAYGMVLPAFLVVMLTVAYPIVSAVIQSFQDEDTGAFTTANYTYFFTETAQRNNLLYTLFVVIVTVVIAIVLAYLLALYLRFVKSRISNAIGMFADFINETDVGLIGVEPGGHGIETGEHGAPLKHGRVGIYFGMKAPMMQTEDGQIEESYSISAGLDFPSVGPQHAYLNSTGRADYVSITDDEALEAFKTLCLHEGIIPALESSHALAHALKMMRENPEKEQLLVVNLSGRGDKDIFTVHDILKARGEI